METLKSALLKCHSISYRALKKNSIQNIYVQHSKFIALWFLHLEERKAAKLIELIPDEVTNRKTRELVSWRTKNQYHGDFLLQTCTDRRKQTNAAVKQSYPERGWLFITIYTCIHASNMPPNPPPIVAIVVNPNPRNLGLKILSLHFSYFPPSPSSSTIFKRWWLNSPLFGAKSWCVQPAAYV